MVSIDMTPDRKPAKLSNEIRVLNYLARHGTATVRDLFKLNINSPTKVISNLRRKGYNITDKVVINPATRTHYKEYRYES